MRIWNDASRCNLVYTRSKIPSFEFKFKMHISNSNSNYALCSRVKTVIMAHFPINRAVNMWVRDGRSVKSQDLVTKSQQSTSQMNLISASASLMLPTRKLANYTTVKIWPFSLNLVAMKSEIKHQMFAIETKPYSTPVCVYQGQWGSVLLVLNTGKGETEEERGKKGWVASFFIWNRKKIQGFWPKYTMQSCSV